MPTNTSELSMAFSVNRTSIEKKFFRLILETFFTRRVSAICFMDSRAASFAGSFKSNWMHLQLERSDVLGINENEEANTGFSSCTL